MGETIDGEVLVTGAVLLEAGAAPGIPVREEAVPDVPAGTPSFLPEEGAIGTAAPEIADPPETGR